MIESIAHTSYHCLACWCSLPHCYAASGGTSWMERQACSVQTSLRCAIVNLEPHGCTAKTPVACRTIRSCDVNQGPQLLAWIFSMVGGTTLLHLRINNSPESVCHVHVCWDERKARQPCGSWHNQPQNALNTLSAAGVGHLVAQQLLRVGAGLCCHG